MQTWVNAQSIPETLGGCMPLIRSHASTVMNTRTLWVGPIMWPSGRVVMVRWKNQGNDFHPFSCSIHTHIPQPYKIKIQGAATHTYDASDHLDSLKFIADPSISIFMQITSFQKNREGNENRMGLFEI